MISLFGWKEVVVAASLLFGSSDDAVPAELNTPAVRTQLQNLAVSKELLDPREVRYMLTRQEDFDADVKLLRQRHAELSDAPPVGDAMRFPERAGISDLLQFNRAYRNHMEAQQQIHPHRWWEYQKVLQETDQLYQIWDTLRDARCEYYYVNVRRQALLRLRERLGPQAYYSGELPPHVPIWRFQRVD